MATIADVVRMLDGNTEEYGFRTELIESKLAGGSAPERHRRRVLGGDCGPGGDARRHLRAGLVPVPLPAEDERHGVDEARIGIAQAAACSVQRSWPLVTAEPEAYPTLDVTVETDPLV